MERLCKLFESRHRAMVHGRVRGFTYVWTLLLVAILGLMATVALELESIATQRDQERELLSIGRQMRTAIASYYNAADPDGRSEYPPTLEALVRDDRVPGGRRHLRKIFVDPVTGKREWGVVRVAGRIVGVHSLSDRVPIRQDGFEDDESDFRGRERLSEWIFVYPPDLLVSK